MKKLKSFFAVIVAVASVLSMPIARASEPVDGNYEAFRRRPRHSTQGTGTEHERRRDYDVQHPPLLRYEIGLSKNPRLCQFMCELYRDYESKRTGDSPEQELEKNNERMPICLNLLLYRYLVKIGGLAPGQAIFEIGTVSVQVYKEFQLNPYALVSTWKKAFEDLREKRLYSRLQALRYANDRYYIMILDILDDMDVVLQNKSLTRQWLDKMDSILPDVEIPEEFRTSINKLSDPEFLKSMISDSAPKI